MIAAEEIPPPTGADTETPEASAARLPSDGGEVHDVLAAEEFPPPAGPDADTVEARAHRLPPDLTGAPDEPHDILAAEEFPPPAHADVSPAGLDPGSPKPSWLPLAAGVGAFVAVLALLRRRRS